MTERLPFPTPPSTDPWQPSAPPSLEGQSTVAIDLETTGLKWWDGHRPIGISLTTAAPNSTCYLPFGHHGGPNLCEATVKRWCREQLKSKHLIGLNIKFDLHHLREWLDLDLGATNSCGDVAHSAALLHTRRTHGYSLDRLAQDFLGTRKAGRDLDAARMAEYPSTAVRDRAESDAKLVWDLEQVFHPQLSAAGLQRVKLLENQLIWPVLAMEARGCPIDLDRLHRWIADSEQDFLRLLWQIYRATHLNINPSSPHDLTRLCQKLNLSITDTADGRPSFTDDLLAAYHHPVIDLVRQARKLASLRSKYLLKYRDAISPDGRLRYALHQLRSDTFGTISGRFSSSALVRGTGGGLNIQQIPSRERQVSSMGDDYVIRTLHRPAAGRWLSADASQIEYRIFAGLCGNPTVLRQYARQPDTSFHHLVWEEMKAHGHPHLLYKTAKAVSFAKIYGAGSARIASMLGIPNAQDIIRLYDRVLPEVAPMLARTAQAAKRQGYITTPLGRRLELREGHFRALNRLIQATAADVLKQKIVDVFSGVPSFTLRFTVHDEICGDALDDHAAQDVQRLLNTQSLDTAIPLLWDVTTGETWGDC